MTIGALWFIAIVGFLILEGVTYQLVSIFLAIGAVGGLVMYMLGFAFVPQMIVFLAVSVLMLCLLRPISVRMMKKNKEFRTNADSLIGQRVYITKEVNNIAGIGEGKVNGAEWTVRSTDDSTIPEGTIAIIERIEGVKLIVRQES